MCTAPLCTLEQRTFSSFLTRTRCGPWPVCARSSYCLSWSLASTGISALWVMMGQSPQGSFASTRALRHSGKYFQLRWQPSRNVVSIITFPDLVCSTSQLVLAACSLHCYLIVSDFVFVTPPAVGSLKVDGWASASSFRPQDLDLKAWVEFHCRRGTA